MKDITKFLQTLHPNSPFEIRVLGIPGSNGGKWTKFGYYQTPEKATADIAEISKLRPEGIYVSVNPIDENIVGRSLNKLSNGQKGTQTHDTEIVRRRWLFLDIDAGQPSGVCATTEERDNAMSLMRHISSVMRGIGWYESIQGASGNGAYLLYEIDLPNDDESTTLLSKVLAKIAELTSGETFGSAHIDTTVYNAGRIMRVLGTWNRKGDEVGDRKHRQSEYALKVGDVITIEQLRELVPPPKQPEGNCIASEFSIIDDAATEAEAKEACLQEPAEWGNDGSQFVLSLCRICKGKGVTRERSVRIVREVLAEYPEFPRHYNDDEIGQRYDQSKIAVGETLKPPPVLANFDTEDKKAIPRDLDVIMADFERIPLDLVVCRGKLHRLSIVGEGETKRPLVEVIDRSEQLFAMILGQTRVMWGPGITKAEFFEAVKLRAKRVDSIELTPHFPAIPNVRYLWKIEAGSTDELERLISLARPHTPMDRDLLRAAICTMSWGGPPGKRPGFAIISSEEMGQNQIGSGKSSTCNICIRPYGVGQVLQHTVRASRDFDQLVKHMVSPSGAGVRAVVLDNVKGSISGQDIESLMTAVSITGHAMYAGFGAIPNYFTWFANGNNLKLSDDVAKRLMPLKIDRANYGPDWDAKMESINWAAVLSGVATVLARPAKPLPQYSRWSLWEAEVLSKCSDDPAALMAELAKRQKGLSETEELAESLLEAIEEFVVENVNFGEEHKLGRILSGSDMAMILRTATGVNWNPRSVARKLRELNFLNGRIIKHPNTALRRYIFVSTTDYACLKADVLELEFSKIE